MLRKQSLLIASLLVTCCVLLQASEAVAQKKGYVTSQACPYSCKTTGLDKRVCRDWRNGNTCYVEDLTKPPAPPRKESPPLTREPLPTRPPYSNEPGGYEPPYGADYQECRNLTGRYIARPHITIYRVGKTGNVFDDKFKVEGEVEGVCIVEAGYFSRGRKRQSVPIRTQTNFQRFRFSVVIESNEAPEIRAYNVNGDSDVLPVDPNDY